MKTKMKIFLLLTFLTFFLLSFTLSNATIRYVSKTGSSTPPYTSWATAADSIMKCIDICVFGDTIYVANGIYKERVDMIPGLTLIGAGMDSCIIDSRDFTYVSGFYTVKIADSCHIEGFNIITYDATQGFGIYIREEASITINSKITFNKIQYASNGIRFSGFSTSNSSTIIQKNLILSVKDGIVCMLNKPRISDNYVYANEDGLVAQINSSPTYIGNTVIFLSGFGSAGFEDFGSASNLKNNLFYGKGAYGMWTYGDSIVNNVIYGTGDGWGTGIFGAGSDIRNNHIENTQTGLYYDIGGGSPPNYQYNNLWNSQTPFQNYSPDTTNTFSDPMFVDDDSMDFHLQMYSPLIDAGDPIILDLDGSRSDIGLYGGQFGESYTYLDLPPKPPRNLTAVIDSIITLSWNRNTEADFSYYNLYRDTSANFTIDTTNLVASLQDTFYLNSIPAGVESLYFKLTAVDSQGNVSSPSEELAVIITSVKEETQIVSSYQLYQNYPNPFNPSTRIAYKLKERGYVKLYVYDIKGELVSVLVNHFQEAGYYEVQFNASTSNGHSGLSGIKRLASGIYIYQIIVRSDNNIPVFSDIKKMILLR